MTARRLGCGGGRASRLQRSAGGWGGSKCRAGQEVWLKRFSSGPAFHGGGNMPVTGADIEISTLDWLGDEGTYSTVNVAVLCLPAAVAVSVQLPGESGMEGSVSGRPLRVQAQAGAVLSGVRVC